MCPRKRKQKVHGRVPKCSPALTARERCWQLLLPVPKYENVSEGRAMQRTAQMSSREASREVHGKADRERGTHD